MSDAAEPSPSVETPDSPAAALNLVRQLSAKLDRLGSGLGQLRQRLENAPAGVPSERVARLESACAELTSAQQRLEGELLKVLAQSERAFEAVGADLDQTGQLEARLATLGAEIKAFQEQAVSGYGQLEQKLAAEIQARGAALRQELIGEVARLEGWNKDKDERWMTLARQLEKLGSGPRASGAEGVQAQLEGAVSAWAAQAEELWSGLNELRALAEGQKMELAARAAAAPALPAASAAEISALRDSFDARLAELEGRFAQIVANESAETDALRRAISEIPVLRETQEQELAGIRKEIDSLTQLWAEESGSLRKAVEAPEFREAQYQAVADLRARMDKLGQFWMKEIAEVQHTTRQNAHELRAVSQEIAPLRQQLESLRAESKASLDETTGIWTREAGELRQAVAEISPLREHQEQVAAQLDEARSAFGVSQTYLGELTGRFESLQQGIADLASGLEATKSELRGDFYRELSASKEGYENANGRLLQLERGFAETTGRQEVSSGELRANLERQRQEIALLRQEDLAAAELLGKELLALREEAQKLRLEHQERHQKVYSEIHLVKSSFEEHDRQIREVRQDGWLIKAGLQESRKVIRVGFVAAALGILLIPSIMFMLADFGAGRVAALPGSSTAASAPSAQPAAQPVAAQPLRKPVGAVAATGGAHDDLDPAVHELPALPVPETESARALPVGSGTVRTESAFEKKPALGDRSKSSEYVVKKGDSLTVIARKVYGKGDLQKKIDKLRGDNQLKTSDLKLGQVLKVYSL